MVVDQIMPNGEFRLTPDQGMAKSAPPHSAGGDGRLALSKALACAALQHALCSSDARRQQVSLQRARAASDADNPASQTGSLQGMVAAVSPLEAEEEASA